MTVQQCHIPPEIWLNVFPNLSKADLANVSLACQSFGIMAQPLLFRSLSVSPFIVSMYPKRRTLHTYTDYEHTIRKLKFFSSPRIAPWVSKCSITPTYAKTIVTAATMATEQGNNHEVNSDLFVDAIFDILPRFVNLTHLSCAFLDISAKRMYQMRSLSLESLQVAFCSADPSSKSPRIRTQRLVVDSGDLFPTGLESDVHTPFSSMHTSFLGLTDLPQLRTLHLAHSTSATVVLASIANGPTLENLRVLQVPYDTATSAVFPEAIARCPNLTELHIPPPISTSRNPGAGSPPPAGPLSATHVRVHLPRLRIFRGPDSALEYLILTQRSTLRDVTLWGHTTSRTRSSTSLLGRTDCDTHLLSDTLGKLRAAHPHLESLALDLRSFSRGVLTHVCAFPHLRNLRLCVSSEASLYNVMAGLTSTTLPTTLISLAVQTELPGEPQALYKDIAPLIGHSVAHCPSFTSLTVRYGPMCLKQATWIRVWGARRAGVVGTLRLGAAPGKSSSKPSAGRKGEFVITSEWSGCAAARYVEPISPVASPIKEVDEAKYKILGLPLRAY